MSAQTLMEETDYSQPLAAENSRLRRKIARHKIKLQFDDSRGDERTWEGNEDFPPQASQAGGNGHATSKISGAWATCPKRSTTREVGLSHLRDYCSLSPRLLFKL